MVTLQANYATAKAGVLGLTKTVSCAPMDLQLRVKSEQFDTNMHRLSQVAKEWGAFNIRCNAVTYGFIATRLTGVILSP